ncbi:uncharacterized protein [Venturia canescens]|uniref:uncharacterized protein n=1 Tax=Venturia canescens TaxID=32260 RepID=UPI001C9C92FF|nr:uncharacterized protein LOC122407134 [Venturia canescens]
MVRLSDFFAIWLLTIGIVSCYVSSDRAASANGIDFSENSESYQKNANNFVNVPAHDQNEDPNDDNELANGRSEEEGVAGSVDPEKSSDHKRIARNICKPADDVKVRICYRGLCRSPPANATA